MGFFGGGNKSKSRGRTDAGPNRTTATKIGVGNINETGKKTASYKSDNTDAFRNRGAEKIKKGVKTPSILLNVGAAILSKPLQAGSKMTRDFYVDKVLGSKNFKGQSKTSFLSMSEEDQEKQYKSYLDSRMSGQTDAYGNPLSQGGGDNNRNQGIEIAKAATGTATTTGPNEIQKTATNTITTKDASKNTTAAILVANKRKSRLSTIKTSATGLNTNYTLAKKKLLG